MCISANSASDQWLAAWGKAAMRRSRQAHSFSEKSHRRTISSSSVREKLRGASSAEVSVTVTVTWIVGEAACINLAFSEGWSEEMLPKSPHQPHSHRLPRIITGLPQCGHRMVAIRIISFCHIRQHLFGYKTCLQISRTLQTLFYIINQRIQSFFHNRTF